jgi:hypothetical protein
MPKVMTKSGKAKTYPYTPKGKAAATKAAQKSGAKRMTKKSGY